MLSPHPSAQCGEVGPEALESFLKDRMGHLLSRRDWAPKGAKGLISFSGSLASGGHGDRVTLQAVAQSPTAYPCGAAGCCCLTHLGRAGMENMLLTAVPFKFSRYKAGEVSAAKFTSRLLQGARTVHHPRLGGC